MLISICIPCMNRAHDLKRTMPSLIAAANASPPVEIAVLDYNSGDDLREYVCKVRWTEPLDWQTPITYRRYTGRDYYHLAHGYNLAVRASTGEYCAIMGTDAVVAPGYIAAVRKLIAEGAVWMRAKDYKGIIVIQRQEFIDAGGYDERFEFYGGEDKDLEARLRRRGAKFGLMPQGLVHTLRTPDSEKTRNYRLPLSKREMMQRGAAIRAENNERGVLIANEGKGWGSWERPLNA